MNYIEIFDRLSEDLQGVNASVQTHKQIQNIVFNYKDAVKKHEQEKEKAEKQEDSQEE